MEWLGNVTSLINYRRITKSDCRIMINHFILISIVLIGLRLSLSLIHNIENAFRSTTTTSWSGRTTTNRAWRTTNTSQPSHRWGNVVHLFSFFSCVWPNSNPNCQPHTCSSDANKQNYNMLTNIKTLSLPPSPQIHFSNYDALTHSPWRVHGECWPFARR